MLMNEEIFREYDIRGVVDKDFDSGFANILGKAFAVYLKSRSTKPPFKVSVGQDARLSSNKLSESLCSGLAESGVEVLRLGLITSPMCYYSTFESPLSGAIMITGSHNPPEYNGFKICFETSTLFGDEIQKIKSIINTGEYLQTTPKQMKDYDIFTPYLNRFGSDISLSSHPKIIVDCGNGCSGVIVRKLFNKMGIQCEILFEEPDGRFPNHHPDPTVEKNMGELKKRVLETNAMAGIGFDGDADRIGALDHLGRQLYGDELMVIFARSVLQQFPGTTIIGDVKCSDRLYNDISKRGGVPVMYKTGHSLIKNKMKETDSKFSGEMSGHVFFADRNYGYDDAVYAGARLVEILARTGKTIPQLLEGLPKAFSTPEIRIDTTEVKKRSVVSALRKEFGGGAYKVNLIDGVRISFDDGFALVRASNTQPVLVSRFEAATEERLKEIRRLIEGAIKKYL